MRKSNNKAVMFLRRNAVYIILTLCILAIGLSVTLVLLSKNGNEVVDEDPITVYEPDDNVVDTDPIVVDKKEEGNQNTEPVIVIKSYLMPVSNATKIEEYSEQMVFNSTLKRYSAHLAVDFFAPEGTPVYSIYDGVVESVETTLIYGTTVVVDHGDGIKAIYNSLADGDSVAVGQKIKKGDKIGEVSVSNRQEYKEGAHLHFEIKENGKYVNPAKFLTFEEK